MVVQTRTFYCDKDCRKYMIVSLSTAIYNLMFYNDYFGALIGVIIESGILLWLLLKKHYIEYLCFYLIFSSVSMEYGSSYYGVETFGLKSFRVCGISLGTLLLFPVFAVALFKMSVVTGKKEKKYLQLLRFERFSLGIILCAIITGIFQLLINDNGVAVYEGAWKEFATEVYSILTLVAIPVYTFTFFAVSDFCFAEKIKNTLVSILVSVVTAQVASYILQIQGNYWDTPMLMVSRITIFPHICCWCFFTAKREADISFRLWGF